MEKQEIQSTKPASFEYVIEDNKEKIYRICRIYANPPLEPSDLFQEVVFQAWQSFSKFEGRSSINTWVYRIALNVCMNSKLKSDRVNNQTVRLDSIKFIHSKEESDQTNKEKYKVLRDCISSLNEAEQTIVILYLEELPYKEIASVTGLTENHIAVKMKRIRKKLFDCVSSKISTL